MLDEREVNIGPPRQSTGMFVAPEFAARSGVHPRPAICTS
jgi:hypothetical protein